MRLFVWLAPRSGDLTWVKLIVEYRKIADLKQRADNARTHSRRQLQQIAASITRFGFTNPVLVDDDDCLIAGHGDVAAAQLVDMTEVPAIRIRLMSEAAIRAYVLADNALALKAGWDEQLLNLELDYLNGLDEDFDLTLTGFELPEIDAILAGKSVKKEKADRLDKVPPAVSGPAVTRVGDIWEIGDHRLICGDATQRATYEALMGDEKATMIFSDPPYNVPIAGHVSGLGSVQHAEFATASGEMTKEQFTSFLANAFINQAESSIDGSIHFQCIDWRHCEELQAAAAMTYR